jgi:hypothetical protein
VRVAVVRGEQRLAERAEDFLDGDRAGGPREHVAAAATADALDQSRLTENGHELADVGHREPFLLGDLGDRDGLTIGGHGEADGAPQAVFLEGGDLHSGRPPGGDSSCIGVTRRAY